MSKPIAVEFLPEAQKFLDELDEKSRKKVFFNIRKTVEGYKGEWFKKMPGMDEIWEFRTLHYEMYIRLLAFWDSTGSSKTLIVCTNGFVKTAAKTPNAEIERAEKFRKAYMDFKKNEGNQSAV